MLWVGLNEIRLMMGNDDLYYKCIAKIVVDVYWIMLRLQAERLTIIPLNLFPRCNSAITITMTFCKSMIVKPRTNYNYL